MRRSHVFGYIRTATSFSNQQPKLVTSDQPMRQRTRDAEGGWEMKKQRERWTETRRRRYRELDEAGKESEITSVGRTRVQRNWGKAKHRETDRDKNMKRDTGKPIYLKTEKDTDRQIGLERKGLRQTNRLTERQVSKSEQVVRKCEHIKRRQMLS